MAIYGNMVGNLADQTYNKDSKRAQSGVAVAEALETKITEPSTEGTSGQVLITDGAGNREWQDMTKVSMTTWTSSDV